VISADDADRFAERWYAAWNSHDLDEILGHYADDIEFSSPFLVALNDDPTGTLHGKEELREYFTRALERFPDLRFQQLETFAGVDSVTLTYISVEARRAAEVMTLNDAGLVVRVQAHYHGGPES
jgi:ketosteroid isomerase-like protein